MTVKFMTVKGPESMGHEPFYIGIPQHERTMSKSEAYAFLAERTGYTLWVESRAGVEDGPLKRDNCRVKYLRVEDPAPRITGGWTVEHEDDQTNCWADGGDFILEGDNLEDAIVTIAGSANQGETWSYEETIPAAKVMVDGKQLILDGQWLDAWYNHLDIGELVRFTVKNAAGEDNATRVLAA